MMTLVLSGRYSPDSILLREAAIARGWSVERLHHWHEAEHLPRQDVVVYGESLFALHIADTLGLGLIEPSADWLAQLPALYRQREVSYTTLAEARTLTQPTFIKPAEGKAFSSQVYSDSSALPSPEFLPDDFPVLMAESVTWEAEYRCFVLAGEVLTLSPYLYQGELIEKRPDEEKQAAREFAQTVLNAVGFPPAGVLDVGFLPERGWAVVEANPAWASGIYGCDPDRVLDVLIRACRESGHLSEEDKRWVTPR